MQKIADMPYHIGLKMEIYPSYVQKRIIAKNDGAERFVYNKLVFTNAELFLLRKVKTYCKPVADRISHLKSSISSDGAIKNSAPFLDDPEIDSMVVANAIKNYNTAWKNFREVSGTGIPAAHKKSYTKRYNTNAHYGKADRFIGDGNVHLTDNNHIRLPKLGRIRFKGDMKLIHGIFGRTCETRIGTVTISMDACGHYFASLQIGSEKPFHAKLPKTGAMAGYDVNLKNLYADSNGYIEPSRKTHRDLQKKIAKYQKKLSRQACAAKKRGVKLCDAKNYQKTRLKLAALQKHVANQRRDFLECISRREVESQDLIVMEDLKVSNLLKNHGLAFAIADASWSSFADMMCYKCKLYGKTFIKVPPHYTSQTCSDCGYVLKGDERLSLKNRDFVCPSCGAYQLRDPNAGKNILNRGRKTLGMS